MNGASGSIPIRRSSSRVSLGDGDAGAAGVAAGSPAVHAQLSALAATDEGIAMLRELQEHNAHLRRELLGAGHAIDRLVLTMAQEEQRARGLAEENARLSQQLKHMQWEREGQPLAAAVTLAAAQAPVVQQVAAPAAAMDSLPRLPQLRLRTTRAPAADDSGNSSNTPCGPSSTTSPAGAHTAAAQEASPRAARSTCTSPGSACSDSGYFREERGDSSELPAVFGLPRTSLDEGAGDTFDEAEEEEEEEEGEGSDDPESVEAMPLLGYPAWGPGSGGARDGDSAAAAGTAAAGAAAAQASSVVCLEEVAVWMRSKPAGPDLASVRVAAKQAASAAAAAAALVPAPAARSLGSCAAAAAAAVGGGLLGQPALVSIEGPMSPCHLAQAAHHPGVVAFDTLRPPGLPPLRRARSKSWIPPGAGGTHGPPPGSARTGAVTPTGVWAPFAFADPMQCIAGAGVPPLPCAPTPLRVHICRDPSLGSSLDRLGCHTPARAAGSFGSRVAAPGGGVPPSPATSRASPRVVGFDCSTPTSAGGLRSPSWRGAGDGSNGSTPRRQPPSPGLLHSALRGSGVGAGGGSNGGTPLALRRNASAPGVQQHTPLLEPLAPLALLQQQAPQPQPQQQPVGPPAPAPMLLSGSGGVDPAASGPAPTAAPGGGRGTDVAQKQQHEPPAPSAVAGAFVSTAESSGPQQTQSSGAAAAGGPSRPLSSPAHLQPAHPVASSSAPDGPHVSSRLSSVARPAEVGSDGSNGAQQQPSAETHRAPSATPSTAPSDAAPATHGDDAGGAAPARERTPPAAPAAAGPPAGSAPGTPHVGPAPPAGCASGGETPLSARSAPDSGRALFERRRAMAREWDKEQSTAPRDAPRDVAARTGSEDAATPLPAAPSSPAAQHGQGGTPRARGDGSRQHGGEGSPLKPPPQQHHSNGQQQQPVLVRLESEVHEVLTASGRRAAPYVPVRGMTRNAAATLRSIQQQHRTPGPGGAGPAAPAQEDRSSVPAPVGAGAADSAAAAAGGAVAEWEVDIALEHAPEDAIALATNKKPVPGDMVARQGSGLAATGSGLLAEVITGGDDPARPFGPWLPRRGGALRLQRGSEDGSAAEGSDGGSPLLGAGRGPRSKQLSPGELEARAAAAAASAAARRAFANAGTFFAEMAAARAATGPGAPPEVEAIAAAAAAARRAATAAAGESPGGAVAGAVAAVAAALDEVAADKPGFRRRRRSFSEAPADAAAAAAAANTSSMPFEASAAGASAGAARFVFRPADPPPARPRRWKRGEGRDSTFPLASPPPGGASPLAGGSLATASPGALSPEGAATGPDTLPPLLPFTAQPQPRPRLPGARRDQTVGASQGRGAAAPLLDASPSKQPKAALPRDAGSPNRGPAGRGDQEGGDQGDATTGTDAGPRAVDAAVDRDPSPPLKPGALARRARQLWQAQEAAAAAAAAAEGGVLQSPRPAGATPGALVSQGAAQRRDQARSREASVEPLPAATATGDVAQQTAGGEEGDDGDAAADAAAGTVSARRQALLAQLRLQEAAAAHMFPRGAAPRGTADVLTPRGGEGDAMAHAEITAHPAWAAVTGAEAGPAGAAGAAAAGYAASEASWGGWSTASSINRLENGIAWYGRDGNFFSERRMRRHRKQQQLLEAQRGHRHGGRRRGGSGAAAPASGWMPRLSLFAPVPEASAD